MKSYPKWQRINYMPCTPLGDEGEYLTGSTAHIELSRKAAAEGMVLLKNEQNCLPFQKGQKLAVFGKAQIDYAKGGGGSGYTYTAYSRNVTEGLEIKENEGKVQLFAPLSAYYREAVKPLYKAIEETGKVAYPGLIGEPELPDELVKEARAFTDTAVITISRFSRESFDRQGIPGDGDFYLSPAEETMVQKVLASFDRVVVLLNTGGMMDVTWFKDLPKVQGVLLLWQAGMEGGLAAADLLCGDATPSGHLADTFADRFASYPNAEHFNDSPDYLEYGEDIFVGYRYFETFPEAKKHVCYPFGYGLSYTAFETSVPMLSVYPDHYTVTVSIKNTGSRAGKAVIQLYAEAPQGKLGKPSRSLIGFKKTKELQPGEEDTRTLNFTKYQLSSYDDLGKVRKSAYVLEKGEYHFYLGENVRDAKELPETLVIPEDEVIEQLTARCTPKRLKARLTASGEMEALPTDFETPLPPYDTAHCPLEADTPDENNWKRPKLYKLKPEERPIDFAEVAKGNVDFELFFSKLSLEQKISLLGGQPNRGAANTFGFGNLLWFNIPNAMTADGPAGVRITPNAGVNTTAFPCATLLACTFNEALLFEIGEAAAAEMAENGFGIWLAPAINIHRNPLCGRNFEYYSEDPYLAGRLASHLVQGVQKHGIAVSVKHFACNNKETNRKESDSRVSERALREIYLKAFEICVKEGGAWTLMSSYNLINGVRASENKDLLTGILRGEWGFDGVVTTDWVTHGLQDREIAAGNTIKMPCGLPSYVLEQVKSGALSEEDVDREARRVLKLILKLA
ncbi:MAG: glycoside hydrolase family 3 C-terminal domain-containing protein [Lachnospiraceae bacterium]|nr:glycoside hydrolase family 3 C-terminal domain-containing protein [Lachnospiraceae bacterium]